MALEAVCSIDVVFCRCVPSFLGFFLIQFRTGKGFRLLHLYCADAASVFFLMLLFDSISTSIQFRKTSKTISDILLSYKTNDNKQIN